MATINPFQGPINYSVDVQSPFEAALSGFKIGAAGAEAQAKTQALEQAKKGQTELAALFKNPNATAADYERVTAFLPKDQAAIVTQGFERKTKAQQENDIKIGGQVYSAIKSGQTDIAKTLLQQQADAYRTGGREQEAKATETYLQLIDMNPTGAQATVGLMMASMPGGKEVLENVDKTLSTGRAEGKAPSELRESVAKAETAETDARVKFETAIDEIAKAKALTRFEESKAENERIKAEFAERVAIADLENKASQLGLNKAQTGSALASTKKLGYESQKAGLELEALKASGGLDPVKSFEQEEKLRKEYQGRTKVYGELGTTYQNMQSSAAAKTGPGDIALITGFMKMLDPGSVVRETEFATARDTAGLYERLKNQATKLESGQLLGLDSKQRNEYVNLAKQYLDSSQKKAGEDKKALGVVVKNYKLNPENVFGPAPKAEPVPGRAPNLPGADRTVEVDY
jgi:hypothetical protein